MRAGRIAVRNIVENQRTANIYCLGERLFAFRLVEGVTMDPSRRPPQERLPR